MARARKASLITHRDLTVPTPKAKPFDAPGWIWELKHDGYRALLIKDGQRVSMLTRRGHDLLALFPEIVADLRKLPDIVIDGELVMLDENGKPEFHQLRGRCAIRDPQSIGRVAVSKPAALFAFDLLQLRGKDLRALPLLRRRAALQMELKRTERIVYCQHVATSWLTMITAVSPALATTENPISNVPTTVITSSLTMISPKRIHAEISRASCPAASCPVVIAAARAALLASPQPRNGR